MTGFKEVVLKTSDEQFDALHQAVEKARKGSKKVSVDLEALRTLLMDQSALIRAIEGPNWRSQ